MWKDTDAEILHGYNIWTRSCSSGCGRVAIEDAVERWVVIRDDDPTGKGTADEEYPESEVYRLECSLEVLAWI